MEPKELRDSHLLPAALYKLVRDPSDKNPDPIVVTPKIASKTSKQVSDYLLCGDCEALFNNGGEAWVVRNCSQNTQEFPIQDAVRAAAPIEQGADFFAYRATEIPAVDIGKLTYFGISVFWRAGVHQFRPVNGQLPDKLSLGPYEEPLRLFLLGKGAFPDHIVLIISVSLDRDHQEFCTFPFLRNHDSRMRQYKFHTFGITFQMFTGSAIPQNIRDLCSVRSAGHNLYVAQSMDEANWRGMGSMLKTARDGKNLKS